MESFLTFLDQPDVWEGIVKKITDRQEKNDVGKDFDGVLNGKTVKLFLPSDTRTQIKMVIMGQELFSSAKSGDLQKQITLELDFYEMILKYCLIDNKEPVMNVLDIAEMRSYGFAYFVEMLLPLYLRSNIKVGEALKQILKGYLKESD